MNLSRRVQGIPISTTKRMPLLAARRGGCVSLGQGVPSFPTPEHVVDAVARALRDDPGAGKYSLQPGLPALRRAVADLLLAEKNLAADPESEIAVTVGAMEGLLAAVFAILEPGDEAILLSPCYPSHVEQILLAGGVPVFAPLAPDGWRLDPEAVAERITPRTRLLIVNSPSNPTGAVFSEPDLRRLADLALERDLWLVCDDTYDYLTFDGRPAFSLASIPEIRDRLVLTGSFSKRFALTGWRVGFAFAPVPAMEQMLKVHDCAAICAPTPSQHAALAALTGPQHVFESFRDALGRRRDLACERLDALADAFTYVRPQGAFYVMARYHFTDAPSMDVATRLINEAQVTTVPGESFGPGGQHHLRMSFGGSEAELNEAFDRIAKFLE